MADVIDAEVVDEMVEKPAQEMVAETHSTALEVRPATREVLMPLDTQQVVEGMRAYQNLLPQLLDSSDWQGAGNDKFVKKSGWRKIARAFNLSVMVVSVRVERDENGLPTRAEAIARAQAPNGQVSDADGYCSSDEPRFASGKGRQKLENDLRATATTRAKNRAISDLVGMGEVSAEEIDAGASVPSAPQVATDRQVAVLSKALNWLLPSSAAAAATWDEIKAQCGGDITGPVANALIVAIKARKDLEAQEPQQGEAAAEGIESDIAADPEELG